jgi:hypothetical protein
MAWAKHNQQDRGIIMSIIAIVVVFTAAILWLLRSGDNSNKTGPKPARVKRVQARVARAKRAASEIRPYRAASVLVQGCACNGAKAIRGKRYLIADVPIIPLPECNQSQCQCRYVRHEDRRKKDERRALYSLQSDLYAVNEKSDRRRGRGRRKSDWEPETPAGDFNFDELEWNT